MRQTLPASARYASKGRPAAAAHLSSRSTTSSASIARDRKGRPAPETGQFSVQLWKQKRWGNNKGIIELEDAGARVFAFKESQIWGTPYRVVKPEEIVEITGA